MKFQIERKTKTHRPEGRCHEEARRDFRFEKEDKEHGFAGPNPWHENAASKFSASRDVAENSTLAGSL